MNQYVGEILALIAALCGAASSLLYNNLGRKADSDILAYARMFIAVPIMCCYALLRDGFVLFSYGTPAVVSLFISGIIGFFVTDLFLFRSYVEWGARETMVVMCLAPVLSGFFAFFFFKEQMTARQIVGSLCSITGIIIMTLGDKTQRKTSFKGAAHFAILAAFFQSVADMTAKSALTQMPWVSSVAIRAMGGLLLWIIYGFVKRKTFYKNFSTIRETKFLFSLTGTVIVGTVIGTTAAMGALQNAPAGIVTSLKQVSPIFILPYEAFVMKKKLSLCAILGTCISVFGVFIIF